jgi:hypothetical protein
MNILLTILTVTAAGDPSASQPTDVLAILSRTETNMLEPCQLIAKYFNDRARGTLAPFSFGCRTATMNIDTKHLAVVPPSTAAGVNGTPFVLPQEQIVATAHLSDSSGKERLLDVFEVFRIGSLMPASFPMTVCAAFTGAITDVKYTCAPNQTP